MGQREILEPRPLCARSRGIIMAQETWQFEVWVARYFDLGDVVVLKGQQNGMLKMETAVSMWDRKGQRKDWSMGGWPPRRVRITVEEIDQPLDDWGPLC